MSNPHRCCGGITADSQPVVSFNIVAVKVESSTYLQSNVILQ